MQHVTIDYKISRFYYLFYENVFFNFLLNFVFKVYVSDGVLSFIGAPELMEFQNQFNQLYFKQDQEAALSSVRHKMLTMGISIIDHSKLFVEAAPLNEKKFISLVFSLRKITKTLWARTNCIKSSVTTTFHPADNSPTRLIDKQQRSGYLTVNVPSVFQRLVFLCKLQVWLKH